MNYNDFIEKLRGNDKFNIDVHPKEPNKEKHDYVQFDCRNNAKGRMFHNELNLDGEDSNKKRCIYIETHFVDEFCKHADSLLCVNGLFRDVGTHKGKERRIRYDKPIACTFDPNGEIDITPDELDDLIDRIIAYKCLTDNILWRLFEMLVRH